MHFPVDFFSCFFAGCFDETEDGTFFIVLPVLAVFDLTFFLGFEVLSISLPNCFGSSTIHISVNI